MKTFQIQWLPKPWLKGRPPEWKDIPKEEWSLEEHANLRMKGYWEKLGFPMEYRVVEVPE